ncbi:hypothetical protein GPROT1_00994 [Gammaproteobacteria bacterium]|nr:hypothetical protein GPROT1_00994 [Gammaproteobacteria bacterium]
MGIDWTVLTPSEFEELCYTLVDANGFQEIQWYGKGGGDKGRDILAKKETAYTDRIKTTEDWIIQCKRYTTQPPGVAQISPLLEQCREHKPDNLLIIVSNTLSSDTKDWLHAVRSEYRFRIHLWEEMDLIREIRTHRKSLSSNFLSVVKQITAESCGPVRFSRTQLESVHYWTNSREFEELGIFILNDYGHKENVRWITDFIEYLRNNDIEFESDDDAEEESEDE